MVKIIKNIPTDEQVQRKLQKDLGLMVKEARNYSQGYEIYRPEKGTWFSIALTEDSSRALYVFPAENKIDVRHKTLGSLAKVLARKYESIADEEFTVYHNF